MRNETRKNDDADPLCGSCRDRETDQCGTPEKAGIVSLVGCGLFCAAKEI